MFTVSRSLKSSSLYLLIGKQKLSYKTIKVNVDDGIAIVELNRPKKKNAFSKEMYLEVGGALNKLSVSNEVRVVLLTGTGDFTLIFLSGIVGVKKNR